jgi:O-antigen/teichoic acid export membrane protein
MRMASRTPGPRVPEESVGELLSRPEAGGTALRGGALRVLGYVVNALLGALTAALLFRHIGVDDTGLYVTAVSIAAIVGGLSDLGITAQGVRELSVRDDAGRRALMASLLGLRSALTTVGVVVAVAISVAIGYDAVVVAGVAITGAALLVQNYQTTLGLSLMSRLRLGAVTATDTGRQVLITAATAALVALGAGLTAFFVLAIPAAAVALVATLWLVRGDVPLLPRFDVREWRALARDLLPYAAAIALSVIYLRLSVIVVSLTASETELGYFGASFRILEALIVIPGLMVTAVFPIFAHSALGDHDRLAYGVDRVFSVMLIVGVWFGIAIALGAPVLIDLIGGEQFRPAEDVLRIQGIGLAGSFLGALWGTVLISLQRRRALVLVNLTALVAGIILVTVLAETHGAEGAALATAITELGLAIGMPFVLARTDPHIVPSLWVVPRVALAAAAAASLALLGLPAVPLVVLATLVYFGVLLAVRAVPAEVLVELRRFAVRRPGADG